MPPLHSPLFSKVTPPKRHARKDVGPNFGPTFFFFAVAYSLCISFEVQPPNIVYNNKTMRKPRFAPGEIYHVYNRGVEKRDVFLDERDSLRFIHDLFEFNDTRPATSSNIRLQSRYPSRVASEANILHRLEVEPPNRKLLVHILAFCLMPKHFHLLIQEKRDGGIVKFMQKLSTGYTMYFNTKYKRVGGLFQGRFKAVLVEDESHFIHLPYYIHCNPLDLVAPKWREGSVENPDEAFSFLKNYRWSSFLDYAGKKNFPSVTQRNFLSKVFGKHGHHEKDLEKWVTEMGAEKAAETRLE